MTTIKLELFLRSKCRYYE